MNIWLILCQRFITTTKLDTHITLPKQEMYSLTNFSRSSYLHRKNWTNYLIKSARTVAYNNDHNPLAFAFRGLRYSWIRSLCETSRTLVGQDRCPTDFCYALLCRSHRRRDKLSLVDDATCWRGRSRPKKEHQARTGSGLCDFNNQRKCLHPCKAFSLVKKLSKSCRSMVLRYFCWRLIKTKQLTATPPYCNSETMINVNYTA